LLWDFSCYLNNAPWRTEARISAGFLSPAHYEVYVRKQYFDSLIDVLWIDWHGGYFSEPNSSPDDISLYIYVPKNFSASDFSSWQGKRLTIDSTTGYFFASASPNYVRGYGTIYFNVATFDTIITNGGGIAGCDNRTTGFSTVTGHSCADNSVSNIKPTKFIFTKLIIPIDVKKVTTGIIGLKTKAIKKNHQVQRLYQFILNSL